MRTDTNRRISTESLVKWASFGRELRSSNQKAAPNWLPARRLIDATQAVLQQNRATARRLLEASNKLFAPLKDPFESRLGLHRWLSGEREEAYSDWLAWIIEQLATAESIIQLLCGESVAELVSKCSGPLSVHRETVFETAESVRRTDIEIWFGQKRAILVEVKMIDADEVTDKQLRDQGHYGRDFERRLLLAPSGEVKPGTDDFTLILWRDICLRLRRLAPSICRRNISVAAMVLAFVGAVEQNLLSFPAMDKWNIVASSTLDYLAASLEGVSDA